MRGDAILVLVGTRLYVIDGVVPEAEADANYPASLVIGILTRTESTKIKVAVGDYNRTLDERITTIKQQCGIQ